ncbi:hypothetical protein U9M48_000267 [Paspalum notatum var. saurae]|uniref:Uncharacterized protein n=1 Tax=Paspalum notatum var. saurae TaxID=547442 RepID=A0AAQ3SEH0_PASNO
MLEVLGSVLRRIRINYLLHTYRVKNAAVKSILHYTDGEMRDHLAALQEFILGASRRTSATVNSKDEPWERRKLRSLVPPEGVVVKHIRTDGGIISGGAVAVDAGRGSTPAGTKDWPTTAFRVISLGLVHDVKAVNNRAKEKEGRYEVGVEGREEGDGGGDVQPEGTAEARPGSIICVGRAAPSPSQVVIRRRSSVAPSVPFMGSTDERSDANQGAVALSTGPHAGQPKPHADDDGFFDVRRLKASLAKALVSFYPLAGRLGVDGSGRAEISCSGDGGGALFVVARSDHLTVDDVSSIKPSPELRRLVVPRIEPSSSSFVYIMSDDGAGSGGGVRVLVSMEAENIKEMERLIYAKL